MNRPVCGKCESTRFKNAEFTPEGSNYALSVTFCAECGTPIGLMDFFNIGKLVQHQARQISTLEKDMASLKEMMDRLLVILGRKLHEPPH